jgi:hypothetical protein
MMFWNNSWFWTGFFTAFASLGAVLIREIWAARAQKSLERIRLHERERLEAYKKLYSFSHALGNLLSPPEDPRRDFCEMMRGFFRKDVEPHMLLFTPKVRALVNEMRLQYHAVGDPDLVPPMPFEEFVSSRIYRLLDEILRLVESQTDEIMNR